MKSERKDGKTSKGDVRALFALFIVLFVVLSPSNWKSDVSSKSPRLKHLERTRLKCMTAEALERAARVKLSDLLFVSLLPGILFGRVSPYLDLICVIVIVGFFIAWWKTSKETFVFTRFIIAICFLFASADLPALNAVWDTLVLFSPLFLPPISFCGAWKGSHFEIGLQSVRAMTVAGMLSLPWRTQFTLFSISASVMAMAAWYCEQESVLRTKMITYMCCTAACLYGLVSTSAPYVLAIFSLSGAFLINLGGCSSSRSAWGPYSIQCNLCQDRDVELHALPLRGGISSELLQLQIGLLVAHFLCSGTDFLGVFLMIVTPLLVLWAAFGIHAAFQIAFCVMIAFCIVKAPARCVFVCQDCDKDRKDLLCEECGSVVEPHIRLKCVDVECANEYSLHEAQMREFRCPIHAKPLHVFSMCKVCDAVTTWTLQEQFLREDYFIANEQALRVFEEKSGVFHVSRAAAYEVRGFGAVNAYWRWEAPTWDEVLDCLLEFVKENEESERLARGGKIEDEWRRFRFVVHTAATAMHTSESGRRAIPSLRLLMKCIERRVYIYRRDSMLEQIGGVAEDGAIAAVTATAELKERLVAQFRLPHEENRRVDYRRQLGKAQELLLTQLSKLPAPSLLADVIVSFVTYCAAAKSPASGGDELIDFICHALADPMLYVPQRIKLDGGWHDIICSTGCGPVRVGRLVESFGAVLNPDGELHGWRSYAVASFSVAAEAVAVECKALLKRGRNISVDQKY